MSNRAAEHSSASSRRFRVLGGILAAACAFAAASPAFAEPTAEQLQGMYDDAMRQLQQAQDRKNQLANENEQLKAKIAELEGKLNAAQAASDPTYALRARAATFEAFLSSDLTVAVRYDQFETEDWKLSGDPKVDPLGFNWPFRVAGVQFIVIQPLPPTTMPGTIPATAPAIVPTTSQATLPATAPAVPVVQVVPTVQPVPSTSPATTVPAGPASQPSTAPAASQPATSQPTTAHA